MSIYVFITRKSSPSSDDTRPIAAEEWVACVSEQPGFRAPVGDEGKWIGKHARIWDAHEYPVAFDHVDGEIWVKGPDAATIVQMNHIADSMRANVFSETGELFAIDGKHAGFLPGYPD